MHVAGVPTVSQVAQLVFPHAVVHVEATAGGPAAFATAFFPALHTIQSSLTVPSVL